MPQLGDSKLGESQLGSPGTLKQGVEWTVVVDGEEQNNVWDVQVVDTANPFGDYAVFKMDDRGGQAFEAYPRGTRVEAYVSEGTEPLDNRFTGYVVERRENEQQGADVLEVEAYSFDQFLRRNTVTNDQTGNTISQALADIIQTDTPVRFNAANITVGDDQELTRSYQGDPVENALRDFAFKSTNEDFGVGDDLEFFFQPRETVHIDRGVDNTQWFRYDIPELGKEAINEVEVWFDDGEESVIVDDGTDKLDLQDSLGLPSPGTQRKELQRPLVTDISDAEDIGRKYLAFRNSTLSGTVTTYGLYDAEPGDTIDITIDPRGIDEEFVIAAIEYRWGVDETILTVVEKRGDVDDILSELSESVQRIEMQGANRDAPKNRITTTNAAAIVSVDVDAGGTSADADRFVNDGRNAVRDAWTGAGNPDIANIVVGDDNSGLSRTNTTLGNQTDSVSVTESLPSAKVVEYSATLTQSGVEEIGLETSTGTLLTRATFETPVDLSSDTVTVTLTVSNDDSVSRGVMTNDGQTAVRDVLADNSPTLPTDYGYGDDSTAVAETDTTLGNELANTSLEEILIQSASSVSAWNTILGTLASTYPLVVSSSGIRPAQTAWTTESDNLAQSGTALVTVGDYSNGEAEGLDSPGDTLELSFTPEHDIPGEEFALWCRIETDLGGTDPGPEITVTLDIDGDTYSWVPIGTNTALGLNWYDLANNTFGGSSTYPDTDIPEGSTVTLSIEATSSSVSGQGHAVDVMAPLDALTRVTGGSDATSAYTFDNNNGGSGGYLDGPELYPDQLILSLETATTRRNVSEARFTLTANDTSGNFYVELANDGSTFNRVNNATSGSVTFASPDTNVDTNISLNRYGSRSTATPQTGFNAQEIDNWELYADIDAVLPDDIGVTLSRAIIPPNTSGIVGQTVREAGLKSGSTLLTRHILAEFLLDTDQRLASSESTRFTSDN
ncbi:baseplate hub [Haloferax tailed virus 1]|uniref:Baseplate hub n=1 Tax=Haloferax tailed virus 1 TaxID=2507575 RepID=A0A410N6T6_HFTV1|nr:baseplate hub [Haloferax tailed virus 1]QAS68877.1 baseplate hub [Haloferax tailed virus 1]